MAKKIREMFEPTGKHSGWKQLNAGGKMIPKADREAGKKFHRIAKDVLKSVCDPLVRHFHKKAEPNFIGIWQSQFTPKERNWIASFRKNYAIDWFKGKKEWPEDKELTEDSIDLLLAAADFFEWIGEQWTQ